MKRPSPEDASSVAHFTHNEYFKSAWIVQEVLNTHAPLLVSSDWGVAMHNLRWFQDKHNQEQVPEARLPADGCWVWEAGSRCFNTHAERLMFAARWQMIEEIAKAHIVTLRSLLGHFTDRHCFDPGSRVFAALNLPLVRKMDPQGYMKAEYAMSREDVLFIVFAFWERLCAADPLNHREGHCMNILLLLHNVLDIERSPTDLLRWLRELDRLKLKQNIDVLVLQSGREIDFLQDLIQNGRLAEKFCNQTPDGARRSNGVPLEKEWFERQRGSG